jgi:Sulfatase-modifying factor enzyme 1
MSRLISFQLSSLIRATVRVELLDVRKWKSEDRSRSWRSVYQAEGRSPATCLNWYDVKAYVDWLAKKTGKHMRGILRQAFQSLHNSRLDPVIVNRARGTRARLVMQAIHSPLGKSAAPFANRALGNPQASRNFLVFKSLRAFQNDPRSHGQRLRRLPPR